MKTFVLQQSFSRLGTARTQFGSALGLMKTFVLQQSFSRLGTARTQFGSALGLMKTLFIVSGPGPAADPSAMPSHAPERRRDRIDLTGKS